MSLKMALEKLGFAPCYHMTELMRNPSHAAFWEQATERAERGESVEWDRVFSEYKATVDWPGCVYYEELAWAYPEAKVVLSVRDPNSWYESAQNTIGQAWDDPARNNTFLLRLLRRLVPGINRQISAVEKVMHQRTFGKASIDDRISNEDAVSAFVQHNEEVKRRMPEDRLLVYSVEEGWAPLCSFLGVEEPKELFPRINDRRSFRWVMIGNLIVGLARAAKPLTIKGAALAVSLLSLVLILKRRHF